MKLTFTNGDIYQIAHNLNQAFDNLDIRIPAKPNFYIQKNARVIATAAQEIDKSRLEVVRYYGNLDEETGNYIVPNDKLDAANKELNELFNIEQELDIKQFSIEDLGSLEFSAAQMQAIMFMIED